MHHLLDAQGQRLFPPKMRLLSHWNLRDEIKADYADSSSGLAKQRMIQQVMERIVTQTIPAVVVNNPAVDWNPFTNEVTPAAVKDSDTPPPAAKPSNAREPDTRYAMLQKTFFASKKADPYSPTAPTLIARRFDEDREIPEARVRAMLEQVLTSPLVPQVAKLIESRLQRPLEPFDVWYSGFRPGSQYTEAQLDEMVAKKYPTAAGLPAGHSQPADETRLLSRTRAVCRQQYRGRSGARFRPRHGRGNARGKSPPADSRGKRRHELQRLQHRRPRNGTQRRADVLPERRRPHFAERRAQHRVHRSAGLRLPGARSRTARPCRRPTPKARRKKR